MKPIRILLADDHALILGGIRALLKEIEGVTIVAEANNDATRSPSPGQRSRTSSSWTFP